MATAKKPIKEYGGREVYASKAAMVRHEKKESPRVERAEKKSAPAKKGK